jgi:hypothetical protein
VSRKKIDITKISGSVKKKPEVKKVGKVNKPQKIKAPATPRRRKV